tara:strand:+ start:9 stop:869 length:861 start_codon:yes stop_codon:yes gene_type:complete
MALYQNSYPYVYNSGESPASGSFTIDNGNWASSTEIRLHDVPFETYGSGSGGIQITGSSDITFEEYYPYLGPGSILFMIYSGSTWSYTIDTITDATGYVIFDVTNLSGPSLEITSGLKLIQFAIVPAGAGAQILNDADNRILTATGNQGEINAEANLTWDGNELNVQGILSAEEKNFDIPHPSKEGWRLRYSVLEGPERGVYIRGKLFNKNYIELPDYWKDLIYEDSITVHLTNNRTSMPHWIESINLDENRIYVGAECTIVNVHYIIYAERKADAPLIIEYKAEQ